MTRYTGIDGCKGGWLLCHWDGCSHSTPRIEFIERIGQLDLTSTAMTAIDIPIGFMSNAIPGGRDAEREARRFLPGKTSSVFSAPCREALKANNFQEALTLNREHSPNLVVGLSRQSAAIIPKMREVDCFITPERQGVLVESHPEVAFAIMNGDRPVLSRKRRVNGQTERKALLSANGFPVMNLQLPTAIPRQWSTDDILDACACAWVARRLHLGQARKFPEGPSPCDTRGLRMEINA